MSDTLTRLCDRARASRAARLQAEATITVARADQPRNRARFTGVVLIDRQQVGWLVGGAEREFAVPPGEHTVAVYFARRLARLSSPGTLGQAVCSASVTLAEGGRADFVCGARPDVVRCWRRAQRVWAVRHLLSLLGVYVVGGAGWLLSPFLRGAVALAVIHLPDRGPLIPLCYRLVGPHMSAFWCAMVAFWVARRFGFLGGFSFEDLHSRFGAPYYLHLAEPQQSADVTASPEV